MRVAMNLGDEDLRYLRELVSIEGEIVERDGRIDRRNAHDNTGERLDDTPAVQTAAIRTSSKATGSRKSAARGTPVAS